MRAVEDRRLITILYAVFVVAGSAILLYSEFTPAIICRGDVVCKCSLLCSNIIFMMEPYPPPMNLKLYIIPLTYAALISLYSVYAVILYRDIHSWRFAIGASATGAIGAVVLQAVYKSTYKVLVKAIPKPVVETALLTIHYQSATIHYTHVHTLLLLSTSLLLTGSVLANYMYNIMLEKIRQ